MSCVLLLALVVLSLHCKQLVVWTGQEWLNQEEMQSGFGQEMGSGQLQQSASSMHAGHQGSNSALQTGFQGAAGQQNGEAPHISSAGVPSVLQPIQCLVGCITRASKLGG